MSGHSKWSTIKRKKEATDAKKGQVFTKLSREISVAAKQGGPDPESNFRLRLAIERARTFNMPAENVKRAIEKSNTDTSSSAFEEVLYEGYGPSGAAVIVEALTDNRNRTVSEVRNVFTRAGGRMGEAGSVAWMFDEQGLLAVETGDSVDPDEVTLAAIDSGALDVSEPNDGIIEICTELTDLKTVQEALSAAGYNVTTAEKTYRPKTTIEPSDTEAASLSRFIEKLEDLDDVQNVYTNVIINWDALAEASA